MLVHVLVSYVKEEKPKKILQRLIFLPRIFTWFLKNYVKSVFFDEHYVRLPAFLLFLHDALGGVVYLSQHYLDNYEALKRPRSRHPQ